MTSLRMTSLTFMVIQSDSSDVFLSVHAGFGVAFTEGCREFIGINRTCLGELLIDGISVIGVHLWLKTFVSHTAFGFASHSAKACGAAINTDER
jgi:hypothetical protein